MASRDRPVLSDSRRETDDEFLGGAVSYKYRVHDARIGRFLSRDPLAPEYPWNSPYAFSENRVIDGVELEGLEFNRYDGKYNPEQDIRLGLIGAGYIGGSLAEVRMALHNRALAAIEGGGGITVTENECHCIDPQNYSKRATGISGALRQDAVYDYEIRSKPGLLQSSYEAAYDSFVIYGAATFLRSGPKSTGLFFAKVPIPKAILLKSAGKYGVDEDILKKFTPGSETGFTGLYDIKSGSFTIAPSRKEIEDISDIEGTGFTSYLEFNGGHRQLSELIGRGNNTENLAGFAVEFHEKEKLGVVFRSGFNERNNIGFGDRNRTLFVKYQNRIMKALKETFPSYEIYKSSH